MEAAERCGVKELKEKFLQGRLGFSMLGEQWKKKKDQCDQFMFIE